MKNYKNQLDFERTVLYPRSSCIGICSISNTSYFLFAFNVTIWSEGYVMILVLGVLVDGFP